MSYGHTHKEQQTEEFEEISTNFLKISHNFGKIQAKCYEFHRRSKLCPQLQSHQALPIR